MSHCAFSDHKPGDCDGNCVTTDKTAHELRREMRIDDIMTFAGQPLISPDAREYVMIRNMLKLAYESGYLHGHRDAGSKVLDIVRKSYR